MTSTFKYLNVRELPQFGDAQLGSIPAGISDSKTLLRSLADALSFPAYFGENWNALYDCLRDLHWTDKQRIILVHEDVPSIPANELKVYLEILRDAVSDWKTDESHELVVVFDEKSRTTVANSLSD